MDAESINQVVDGIWDQYDTDGSGQLDNSEIKVFVEEVLKTGAAGTPFESLNFETALMEHDTDANGKISKDEMKGFIKKLFDMLNQ